MFFLGGINSVLPYVLYLSLVWVFLIIGFSGNFLHDLQDRVPRVFRAESIGQKYDSQISRYYSWEQQKEVTRSGASAPPAAIRHVILDFRAEPFAGDERQVRFTSCLIPANVFRGPPQFVT